MNYGVKFNGKHSYKDFGLIMQKVSIGMPKVKTEIVDIPGADGSKDLSEALAGRPLYGNREIDIALVSPHQRHDWLQMISRLANFIHGKSIRVVFDADPDYYYKGRCSVEKFDSGEMLPDVSVKISAEPYKVSERTKLVQASGSTYIGFDRSKNITVTEIVPSTSGMSYTVDRKSNSLSSGVNKVKIKLDGQMQVSGYGKVEIKYEEREI
ncbi:hypothetical protein [Peptostreptococcus anaerobius]|uniref:hypothetical protein n=1 Tax=Peptostreptococcus anaerobius TaxID=1261 RepID=UPI0034A5CD15